MKTIIHQKKSFQIKAFLFDWDNTLVDTWPTIHTALNSTLELMGHAPWTREELKARAHYSARDVFPTWFGDRAVEAETHFYKVFKEIALDQLTPLPGAEALLEHLTQQKFPLAIISNKKGKHLREEVTHLGWDKYFKSILGSGDTPADKPAADSVYAALKVLEINPSQQVWFIGDTPVDIQCALLSGCQPILIGSAIGEKDLITVKDCWQLLKILT